MNMTENRNNDVRHCSTCLTFVNDVQDNTTLPESLPECISCMLQPVPEVAKPATAMAVFSALRVMLSEVKFRYVDNTLQEPCFQNLCIAEHASGKSAIRQPLKEILHEVQNEDMASREEFEQWREQCAKLSANEARPAEPTTPIRIIQADCTNPALVRLAKRAAPYSLYTYGEELEKLLRLKNFSEVIRSAYDSEVYGQERVSAGAVSEVVQLRWSFNFSTTPATARKTLKNDVLNGTLSRLCISTIMQDPDDWGEEWAMYGDFGEDYRAQVSAYTHFLQEAKGIIECQQAKDWALREKKRQTDRLKMMDAKYMLPFLFRSLQMGFWRACMLWIMQGRLWSERIEQFASWSIEYDLFNKMHFFGEMIEMQSDNDNGTYSTHRTTMLLPQLPETFTRDEAREMRRLMGKSTTSTAVKNMLGQWVHRGLIVWDEEKKAYSKTAEYTSALAKCITRHRTAVN